MITASARASGTGTGESAALPLSLLCSGRRERAPRRQIGRKKGRELKPGEGCRGSCDPAETDATGGGTEEGLAGWDPDDDEVNSGGHSDRQIGCCAPEPCSCRPLLAHRIGRAGPRPLPPRGGLARRPGEPRAFVLRRATVTCTARRGQRPKARPVAA